MLKDIIENCKTNDGKNISIRTYPGNPSDTVEIEGNKITITFEQDRLIVLLGTNNCIIHMDNKDTKKFLYELTKMYNK